MHGGAALTGHPVLVEVEDDGAAQERRGAVPVLFLFHFYILYKAAAAVILFSTLHLI